jgi:hypothetical protein
MSAMRFSGCKWGGYGSAAKKARTFDKNLMSLGLGDWGTGVELQAVKTGTTFDSPLLLSGGGHVRIFSFDVWVEVWVMWKKAYKAWLEVVDCKQLNWSSDICSASIDSGQQWNLYTFTTSVAKQFLSSSRESG